MTDSPPNLAVPARDDANAGHAAHWNRVVRIAGWSTIISWLLSIPLSFGIAVVTQFNSRTPPEIAALQGALGELPVKGGILVRYLRDYLSGQSFLASQWVTTAVYLVPICVSTAALAAVWQATRRRAQRLTAANLATLRRFAVGFGLSCILMYPMFTQDFWLSVAWGRMIAQGDNPYYAYFTASIYEGLPLFYEDTYMTYGPLWGWICALVAVLGHRVEVWEFLIFKGLLLGAWIACLSIICRVMRHRPIMDQALAVLLFGWMPMSYFLTVAEGHNDIVMVLPMMGWLLLLSRGNHLASPWALAISVLIKYITLPLALVELWHGWSAMRGRRRAYTAALVACAAVAVLCVMTLARDLEFLTAARRMQDWHMLTPAKALYQLAIWLHLPIPGYLFSGTVLLAGLTLIAYYAWPVLGRTDVDQLLLVSLAGLLVILLVVVGHVWPWFVLWVLAPAVVVRRCLAKDIAIALALGAPFVHVYWIWGHEWAEMKYATVLYFAVVGGMVASARISRRGPDAAGVLRIE